MIQLVNQCISNVDSRLTKRISDPGLQGFVDFIPNIRCDPLQLIYRVWKKALTKGRYSRLDFIEALMIEYRKRTEGKAKGLLFKSVGENFKIDNLRKLVYRPTKNKRRYDELAGYIYQKSFVEKTTLS